MRLYAYTLQSYGYTKQFSSVLNARKPSKSGRLQSEVTDQTFLNLLKELAPFANIEEFPKSQDLWTASSPFP